MAARAMTDCSREEISLPKALLYKMKQLKLIVYFERSI